MALSEQFDLDLDSVREKHGPAEAEIMRHIADGTATPMLTFVEPWLAEGGRKGALNDRTKRQRRADVKELHARFQGVGVATIEGVTKKLAGRYVTEALVASGMKRWSGDHAARVTAVSIRRVQDTVLTVYPELNDPTRFLPESPCVHDPSRARGLGGRAMADRR